jgi:hypothetical protein
VYSHVLPEQALLQGSISPTNPSLVSTVIPVCLKLSTSKQPLVSVKTDMSEMPTKSASHVWIPSVQSVLMKLLQLSAMIV